MKTSIYDEIEFFLLKFIYSNSHTLIPRLETESLVREVIKEMKVNRYDILIDVWVWSGIIPISIEKNISKIPYIYGIDISEKALEIAQINILKHNSKVRLINSDLLDRIISWKILVEWLSWNVMITANLPYIRAWDYDNMSEDTVLEPDIALFGWDMTWFELYEKLFKQAIVLKQNMKISDLVIMCEFGFDQEKIASDFFDSLRLDYDLFPDLRWINRFAKVII